MKNIIFFMVCLVPFSIFGQNEVKDLIQEGVALHDAGKYEEAISIYKKALDLDKNSSQILYEIGFSYFMNKEYKKSVKHMDKVLKNENAFLVEAFTIKGSALDNLGKPKEAIKIYNEAISKFPENYLLYYNVALTQYRTSKFNDAEENLKKGILLNPTHASSNYLLGIIMDHQGKRIQSLLATHFFLLIEPNTERSVGALNLLDNLMNQGVSKKDEKTINVTINDSELDNEFSAANLMLSLMGVSGMTEGEEGKSKAVLFYENTESIFNVLKELAEKDPKKGIWWEFYVDFYSQLVESENMEAYSYYISQSNGAEEEKWLTENKEKVDELFKWLNE